MKHLEIKTIEYNGHKIIIKIDYDREVVSLVEAQGKNNDNINYSAKQWVFANRGIEYMNGWIIILDAIKFAIQEAKKDLQSFLDERAKEKEEMIIKMSLKENERSK